MLFREEAGALGRRTGVCGGRMLCRFALTSSTFFWYSMRNHLLRHVLLLILMITFYCVVAFVIYNVYTLYIYHYIHFFFRAIIELLNNASYTK